MPRKDLIHDAVRAALVKDGWTITHDPMVLPFYHTDVYIDLGAETAFAAERAGVRIAVEVKTFGGVSAVTDLERALGQYHLYRYVLAKHDAGRVCVLAVPNEAYHGIFSDAEVLDLVAAEDLRLVVVDIDKEVVTRWMPHWSM